MLTNFLQQLLKRTFTAIILLLCLIGCLYAPIYLVSCIIGFLGLAILVTEWPKLVSGYWWLLTPFYPVLPFVLAILINQDPGRRYTLLLLVLCVCAHDTGAYLVGNLVGKNLLAPSISPRKTWQGFFGGCLGVIIVFYSLFIPQNFYPPLRLLIPVALIISCSATAGDLFESWLKRKAGVKDSGFLLPGHGGLLDRFDGMMSCIYILYALLYYMH